MLSLRQIHKRSRDGTLRRTGQLARDPANPTWRTALAATRTRSPALRWCGAATRSSATTPASPHSGCTATDEDRTAPGVRTTELSRPAPPPARRHAAARRAATLARGLPALDSIDIRLYRDHNASKREQAALPRTSAKETGRAVAYNDVITVPPRHCKHQTSYDRLTSCSSSTPDRYPPVLNLNAPEHQFIEQAKTVAWL
jgi:hypothetical protein